MTPFDSIVEEIMKPKGRIIFKILLLFKFMLMLKSAFAHLKKQGAKNWFTKKKFIREISTGLTQFRRDIPENSYASHTDSPSHGSSSHHNSL